MRTDPRRQEGSRWRDIDPTAVRHATAGLLTARQLTTDERRRAVTHLAAVERLTDREIAYRLRWTGWTRPRPEYAVARFRQRWNIPAAASHGRPVAA